MSRGAALPMFSWVKLWKRQQSRRLMLNECSAIVINCFVRLCLQINFHLIAQLLIDFLFAVARIYGTENLGTVNHAIEESN